MSSRSYPRLSPIVVALVAAVIAGIVAVLIQGALVRGVLTTAGVFVVLMVVQLTRRAVAARR
jgi:uncharacterized membrane protein YjjP (DUF1212 family)